jgi:hypothetical protein
MMVMIGARLWKHQRVLLEQLYRGRHLRPTQHTQGLPHRPHHPLFRLWIAALLTLHTLQLLVVVMVAGRQILTKRCALACLRLQSLARL